jgi:tetratricopeptide (TPR) repeat protein
MKAEHRKELQTNTLAHTLETTVQRLKEGPSKNTVIVLVLIGLVAVLFFTWRYFSRSARENDSARWLQWDELSAPLQLDTFLQDKEAEGTSQSRLARFLEARRRLYEGTKDLGANKGRATEDLRRAADLYGKLAEEGGDRPLLHQEALLGCARAYESLGEYDRAKGFYEQLANKYPDTARGESAKKALERLNNPSNAADLKDLQIEYKPTATTGAGFPP